MWRGYGVLVLLAALTVAGWLLHTGPARRTHCERCAVVRGGDGGGWPRARPEQESLDGAAAARAVDYARQQDASALLVARRGHLIIALEKDPEARIASQGLAASLPELSGVSEFDAARLSNSLWRPLNAADAQLDCPKERNARCTLWARGSDWMRIGQLILDRGRFEGERVLDGRLIEALRGAGPQRPGRLLPAANAQGAEPLVDAGGDFLRGEGHTRLWLAPSVDLVVLLLANDRTERNFDETELPNLLVRGLRDRPASQASPKAGGDDGRDAPAAAALAPGH